MNKCEGCGREFRTIQELHGHQRIEDIGRVLGLVLMDVVVPTLGIVGAIVGGTILGSLGVLCYFPLPP